MLKTSTDLKMLKSMSLSKLQKEQKTALMSTGGELVQNVDSWIPLSEAPVQQLWDETQESVDLSHACPRQGSLMKALAKLDFLQ